jgi:CubicO group peptidase (beta-lactamase class C family)
VEPSKTEAAMEDRVQARIPDIEAYIASGMKGFDVPGVAIGIVAGDKLVYAKGFGVRSKGSAVPVDTRTIFQIGSTTKAFLATTLAIMIDRGKLRWGERVVDLDPDFQLKEPWVTREFRVFDLLAQRSGLPPYVNDGLGMLGLKEASLIRSLRHVEPVSSFRSTFAYTNITHLLAGRIVAKAAGASDGDTVLRQELLEPLGMKDSSYTAEAIIGAANHAEGYLWTPNGTIEVPFTQVFPYDFGGAGDINSTIEDMARWVRLQLGNGSFEGRRIVSPENLAFTRTPKVAMSDKISYALGWVIQQTQNGNIVWHDGGTSAFGAYVGMVPDKSVGVIVLTNETNVGFPDAIGLWTLDRILDNPKVDYVADTLRQRKPNSRRRPSCLPSLPSRDRSRRSHRSPAISSIRASARWRWPRKAVRCSWRFRRPAPNCNSSRGTAMLSRSSSCRSADLQQSQKISVLCRSDSSNFRWTRTLSSICCVSPMMTVRPMSSSAGRHSPNFNRLWLRLSAMISQYFTLQCGDH